MSEKNNQIDKLTAQLKTLIIKHNEFSHEIKALKNEIVNLKRNQLGQKKTSDNAAPAIETKDQRRTTILQTSESRVRREVPDKNEFQDFVKDNIDKKKIKILPNINFDLEKFIGENLINKIGIIITIIGVAIGAKYSIENNLISPLTRIILGYMTGLALLITGIKLKAKYENYSAVLVSGAIAIMYFITYAAYSFYGLIPQLFAFIMMVVFTAFTVVAAINYNKQLIAIIGLVGAYAVPFLLGDNTGQAQTLFSYIAIINVGILFIAFKKYWKQLYFSSFILTWLSYLAWYSEVHQTDNDQNTAVAFLCIFFVIFYVTFLAYKLIKNQKFEANDIWLLLTNSFIFYGVGYAILNQYDGGKDYLGLFTVANGLIHFVVSVLVYKREFADKNLFYLVSGLVLIFITIAIPVQLDGNWVTLMWAAEAALLFWIGRTKNVDFYEKLSYIVMIIAFVSQLQDWEAVNNVYNLEITNRVTPLLNINFLTSILFTAAFGFIFYINQNKRNPSAFAHDESISKLIFFAIPAIFLFALYSTFKMEIDSYWTQLYADSKINAQLEGQTYARDYHNKNLLNFKSIWVLNYSMLFFSLLSFFNIKKFKNNEFGWLNIGLNIFSIIGFLFSGLYTLSKLRDAYLSQHLAEFYDIGTMHIAIRYISFIFFFMVLYACYQYLRQDFLIWKRFKEHRVKIFEALLFGSILWIASSELIHLMKMGESTQSYKLGLSILWAIYSLFLVSYGIWKNKKHLRIWAIGLFGITLMKLFFYDLSHLSTISKTIVLVTLGIILLIISFLYNKYKLSISNEDNV